MFQRRGTTNIELFNHAGYPATTINTSLYCGADSNTTAADTSQTVPISRAGNARIHDRSFNVPATCLAPVIPTDGGLPQIKDPAACQAAANACRTACAP